MSYYLYLDDDPERTPAKAANNVYSMELRFFYRLEDWFIVRSYDQFVLTINRLGLPKCISLDHDLGKDEKTGYDCAVWLLDFCNKRNLPVPHILCHSWNPDEKERILQLFRYTHNDAKNQI